MPDVIEQLGTRIKEPAAPATLAPSVMARIARQSPADDRRVRAAAVQSGSGWWWACAAAGIVMFAALVLRQLLTFDAAPGAFSSRSGMGYVVWLPGAGPDALAVGLALCLLLVGLFAPLRASRKS
jgi:hypothetical protein